MSSMEEFNNIEHNDKDTWGFDKKLPISLIVVVVAQILTTTWAAAVLSTNVENFGKKLTKIERDLDAFIEKADDKFQIRYQHVEEKAAIRREIDMIEDRIRLIEQSQFSKDMWQKYLRSKPSE